MRIECRVRPLALVPDPGSDCGHHCVSDDRLMQTAFRRLACFAMLLAAVVAPWTAGADDAALGAIDRASRAQAAALDLLQQHHQFEEDLVKRESDRVTIFFSTRQADNLSLAEISLLIDGKRVVSHRYSPDERRGLQGRAVQLLHSGRIEPGVHEFQVVVQLDSGGAIPMAPQKFGKGRSDKFIEIQLIGGAARSYAVLEW
jgi:hypothetical protein